MAGRLWHCLAYSAIAGAVGRGGGMSCLEASGKSSICSGWLASIIGHAPAKEAAHAEAFPGEGFEVDAGGGKRGRVLAVDADGEIAMPVLGEIQIDPAPPSPTGATVPSTS